MENDYEEKQFDVLKVNGDYKDCRFRNTEKELSNYPEELSSYLDAIFKNFGLITCGWSATWDKALIKQIIYNKEHRYSFYYSYVDGSNENIQNLSKNSNGEAIHIIDADNFFMEMNERIKALEMIANMNVGTDVEVAIARVKTYIADSKKLIQYTDLYESVTNQLLQRIKTLVYGGDYPKATLFENAIAENTSALNMLLPMSIVAIRWAMKEQYAAIIDSLRVILNRKIEKPSSYYEDSLKMNHIVDTVYLYGLGLSCLYYSKFDLLDQLLSLEFFEHTGYVSPYVIEQDNCDLLDQQIWNGTTSSRRIRTPFSYSVANALRPYFSIIQEDKEFFSFFCVFEKIVAMYYFVLVLEKKEDVFWPPMGMFSWWPYYYSRGSISKYQEFFDLIDSEREEALPLKSGMFEGSYQTYKTAYDSVTAIEKKALARMY